MPVSIRGIIKEETNTSCLGSVHPVEPATLLSKPSRPGTFMASFPRKDDPIEKIVQALSPIVSTIPATQHTLDLSIGEPPHVAFSPASPSPPQKKPSAAVTHPSPSLPASLPPSSRRRRTMRDVPAKQPPRKGDCDYIKRPENAFILFRTQMCEEQKCAEGSTSVTKKLRQAELSKVISQKWRTLPLDQKQYWKALEQAKKAWHDALYPNYVYHPSPRKKRTRKAKKNNIRKGKDTETQLFRFVPVSPNDAEKCGLAHASDPDCGAFRPQPEPITPADDQLTIPEQTLVMNTEGHEAGPVVVSQHPSDGLFAQSFENASALDNVTLLINHDVLDMGQSFENVDTDDFPSHAFLAPNSPIPEVNMIPHASSSPDVLSTPDPDTFSLPLIWDDASMSTSRSLSMSHNRLPESDPWVVDEPEPSATLFKLGGWESYTHVASFGDEQFGFHFGPGPEQSSDWSYAECFPSPEVYSGESNRDYLL